MTSFIRFTSTDLNLLPNDGKRYEIINGELYMTRAPHWKHQRVCSEIHLALGNWCKSTKLGTVAEAPGIVFSDDDDVIPDLIWISNETLATALDESGHLTKAPELIIEVLSKSTQKQDRDLKLKLYSRRGVREYWLVDWVCLQLEVYRRDIAFLKLVRYKEKIACVECYPQ